MTVVDLPAPPGLRIDPQTQRDVVDDPAALDAYIGELQGLLAGGLATGDELAVRARLGVALRVAGRLDEAVRVLAAEVTLALELAEPARVHHARIRLAHAYQSRGEFARADGMFAELLAVAGRMPDRTRAYTLQHAGRNAYEQARWAQAAELFGQALALRERMHAPAEEIESSRNALAAAQREAERETEREAGATDEAAAAVQEQPEEAE